MAWEYKSDLKKRNEPIMDWLNGHGSRGWRLVSIDADWVVGLFEREIAINEKLRKNQLEGDDVCKNEKSKSRD